VVLKNHVLDLVARMSSRVFLGPELCRDPRWLEVTKNYTVDAFIAADKLRLYPASLRWFLNYILPECKSPTSQTLMQGSSKTRKGKVNIPLVLSVAGDGVDPAPVPENPFPCYTAFSLHSFIPYSSPLAGRVGRVCRGSRIVDPVRAVL
jgi:hypothetical protein